MIRSLIQTAAWLTIAIASCLALSGTARATARVPSSSESTATPAIPAGAQTRQPPAMPATASTDSLFRRACDDYREGAKLVGASPSRARVTLLRAASGFEQLLAQSDLVPGTRKSLNYNLGNCRLLAGQNAEAILAYRRAQRWATGLSEFDERIDANLAEARKRVTAADQPGAGADSIESVEPGAQSQPPSTSSDARHERSIRVFSERLAAAARQIPPMPLAIVLGAAWVLCWTFAGIRLFSWRGLPPRSVIAVTGLIGAVAGAVLIGPVLLEHSSSAAVVMREIVPRNGPDAITFTETGSVLAAGSEVRITAVYPSPDKTVKATTPRWVRIRPENDPSAVNELWVPESAVELIGR